MTTLPNIGKPATHALASIGVTTLEQVRTINKKTLLKIHGIGPKAIKIIEEALLKNDWTFDSTPLAHSTIKTDFAVIGSLNCDNAPKKRMIRDYLIASTAVNQSILESLLSESLKWIVPGELQIDGRTHFIQELLNHQEQISSLEILSIITHGKNGSAHGIMTTKKGGKIYFSDIFRFSSHQKDARITQITSFVTMS